jgi:hypothetical protein
LTDNACTVCHDGDDLLARVYERFLGNTITVSHSRVEVTEKREVQHAKGVYTPRIVDDSILRRVVRPKITGQMPLDVRRSLETDSNHRAHREKPRRRLAAKGEYISPVPVPQPRLADYLQPMPLLRIIPVPLRAVRGRVN